MRRSSSRVEWVAALMAAAAVPLPALDWLDVPPLTDGKATVRLQPGGQLNFLRFGDHAFAPDAAEARPSGSPFLVAPFQQLWIESRHVPAIGEVATIAPNPRAARDSFWDQLIVADPAAVGPLPHYRLVESGSFGRALPEAVRRIDLSAAEVARQQASLTDPIIPARVDREIPWTELEAAAWPLDFQKVLLASPNDEFPAFAYQNGQWFTTWWSRDLPAGCKEDHWFASALLIGDTLVRPAPLSARTAFVRTADGVTLPLWTLEWAHEGVTVRQRLFSHRPAGGGEPRVFVEFQLRNATDGMRLALGAGRRPSSHYWDEVKAPHPRSPVPYFSVAPRYRRDGRRLLGHDGRVVLASAQPFRLEPLGPLEALLVFEAAADGTVRLQTPQTDAEPPAEHTAAVHAATEAAFAQLWAGRLRAGARVRLPSPEWQERIDAWRAQLETITRVHYQGRERLAYGAYFYQDYFGIEEAWPVVALAQWGREDEAKRQAEIMLEPGNLDKGNVHHQSRNGAAPLAAATVARLTRDRAWLERIAPALRECAEWTERVRSAEADPRPPELRGLLPPHIYGGDVRDPATSLYATAACWRGMQATAGAFIALGTPGLQAEGRQWAARAEALRRRLAEVFRTVTDRGAQPAFVPFALALPSLGGRNEGSHERLTATRYGNYWNLFAPSFLELDFRDPAEPAQPNDAVFDYAQQRGGLWAGLPRFYDGLDAAYAAGHLGHLLERATRDGRRRPQALAALEAFMLHGSSRNGHTIPEVAGLFPHRLQAAAYERLVREAPWHFGMYDAHRYLAGHISFTEPLGAVAGAALSLVRGALLSETRDDVGQPDGGLVVLPAVPADWLAEGREIVLEGMPTAYGRFSATIRSHVGSRREIVVDYRFTAQPADGPRPLRFRVRLAAPGEQMREIEFVPESAGQVRARF